MAYLARQIGDRILSVSIHHLSASSGLGVSHIHALQLHDEVQQRQQERQEAKDAERIRAAPVCPCLHADEGAKDGHKVNIRHDNE